MSNSIADKLLDPPTVAAPPVSQTLRTLFMTLFLRGRSARGLQKDQAPKSVAQKLRVTLLLYAAFGLLTLPLVGQSVLLISVYLHAMTFVFLGMFIASSAGEVLFNRDEADILLHRPIAPRMLLRAKIRVIVEVSLWLALAFNLVGFFVGLGASDGSWRFPFAHLLSTLMMTMFCTGSVVLVYQLCLRWFGREWLDNIMTTAQVMVSIGAVVAGQVVPQLLFRTEGLKITLSDSWWPMLLPPAWFAAIDDVLSSSPSWRSVFGAALAIASTGLVLWLSYAKLSDSYQEGLQTLGEARSATPKRGRARRFLERVVDAPPLKWILRDSIVRSSFLLTIAYLMRDRDVKLRVYPGLAPL
jgi:ABC-2 type transport system permease protein